MRVPTFCKYLQGTIPAHGRATAIELRLISAIMSETKAATKPTRGPRLRVAQLPHSRLRRPDTILLIVDVQDRLLPAMPDAENLIARCVLLARAARELEIPVVITEQNPTRLGATCQALRQVCDEENHSANTIAKTAVFRCDKRNRATHRNFAAPDNFTVRAGSTRLRFAKRPGFARTRAQRFRCG